MEALTRPQTCLVTGGAGFIGSHLVEGLLAQGLQVRVIDNFSTGKLDNLAGVLSRIELVQGDIRDSALLQHQAKGMDVILHHAALASVEQCTRHPLEAHDINVTGTLNVLEAARLNQVKKVIFASSAAVYGPTDATPLPETATMNPVSAYGLGKSIGEQYCELYSRLYDMTTICFRYFNVYGPRQCVNSQYSGVISAFFHAATQGGSPTLYGDGEQSRDFVSVNDIRDINVATVLNPNAASGVYNIGTGTEYPIRLILEWLQQEAGFSFTVNQQPERRKDPRHSISNITKAQDTLGYYPKTSFYQGLQQLLEAQHRTLDKTHSTPFQATESSFTQ